MRRILLVEDNPGDIALTRAALAQGGAWDVELTVVATLAAAIGRLHDDSFDAVLLDLSLPDSDRASTLPRLVDASPTVAIVVLSGQIGEAEALEAVRLGAQDLILKDELHAGGLLARTIHYAVERKRGERLLAQRAFYDALTGLPTRALLRDRWAGAKTRARRQSGWIGVLFIDLDGFKAINDTHGHGRGDHLLVVLAERMNMVVREHDTVARYGGDEFVILLEAIRGMDDAVGVAEKIAQAIAQPVRDGTTEIGVSASIGVAACHHGACGDLDELINIADRDMYARKGTQRRFAAQQPGAA